MKKDIKHSFRFLAKRLFQLEGIFKDRKHEIEKRNGIEEML
jgi:hypothetical protein